MAAPKDCCSRPPVTHLSLACHNQGVRLKIRKAVYVGSVSVWEIYERAKTVCRKTKAASGPDSDLENGRQNTDQPRPKYRRLMPNDHDTHLEKYRPEPCLDGTAREHMLQHWVQSSRQTSFGSSPNPMQYMHGPSLYVLHPPGCAKDGQRYEEDEIEDQMDGPQSSRLGRHMSASDSRWAIAPNTGVSIATNHQHQGPRTSECDTNMSWASPSWLREHQKAQVPALSAGTSPWDLPVASQRTSVQPQLISPPSPAFHHQGQILPGAAYSEEWDCINMSIPSPTGPWLPLQTDPGFAGSTYGRWAGTSG